MDARLDSSRVATSWPLEPALITGVSGTRPGIPRQANLRPLPASSEANPPWRPLPRHGWWKLGREALFLETDMLTPLDTLLDLLRRTDGVNLELLDLRPDDQEVLILDRTLGAGKKALIIARGYWPCVITAAMFAVIKEQA